MMLNILKFTVMFLCITSCLTIERSSDLIDEQGDRDLAIELKNNIFYDFLWTTPPLYSKELNFQNRDGLRTVEISFGDAVYDLVLDNEGKIMIKNQDQVYLFQAPKFSKENLYYNIDLLKTRLVPRQRMVPETQFVSQMVPVTRSVPVTRTRLVTSFGPNGTTSTHTETYTDFQLQTFNEWRTVPQTVWVWRTVYESVLDIPAYEYYSLSLPDRLNLLIYKVRNNNGEVNYFLQNCSYLVAEDVISGFWGDEKIKLLMIDANSNGYYFDDDDRILFNTWNPYEQNSEYKEINNFMDNFWYRYRELKTEKFISIIADKNFKRAKFQNANSKYLGNRNTGKILVTDIPLEADVIINGTYRFQDFSGNLKRKIEYGVYKMTIKYEGHLDDEVNFIIDENNPQFEYQYIPTPPAGILKFENDYLRNWSIHVSDAQGYNKIYYNEKEINLPSGEFNVIISSGGFQLNKTVIIREGMMTEFNYNDEINKLSKTE